MVKVAVSSQGFMLVSFYAFILVALSTRVHGYIVAMSAAAVFWRAKDERRGGGGGDTCGGTAVKIEFWQIAGSSCHAIL
jgi:hypothetical protein